MGGVCLCIASEFGSKLASPFICLHRISVFWSRHTIQCLQFRKYLYLNCLPNWFSHSFHSIYFSLGCPWHLSPSFLWTKNIHTKHGGDIVTVDEDDVRRVTTQATLEHLIFIYDVNYLWLLSGGGAGDGSGSDDICSVGMSTSNNFHLVIGTKCVPINSHSDSIPAAIRTDKCKLVLSTCDTYDFSQTGQSIRLPA